MTEWPEPSSTYSAVLTSCGSFRHSGIVYSGNILENDTIKDLNIFYIT